MESKFEVGEWVWHGAPILKECCWCQIYRTEGDLVYYYPEGRMDIKSAHIDWFRRPNEFELNALKVKYGMEKETEKTEELIPVVGQMYTYIGISIHNHTKGKDYKLQDTYSSNEEFLVETNFPDSTQVISLKNFRENFKLSEEPQPEETFEFGEEVLVSQFFGGVSDERIFICDNGNGQNCFLCVDKGHEEEFRKGHGFKVFPWPFIKKKPKVFSFPIEEAIQALAEKKGISVEQVKIVEA